MIEPIAVNVTPARRLLKRVQDSAKDITPVLKGPIRNDVHAMFKKIWETEGNYIGNPWPQLAASTLAAKRRKGRGNMGILRMYNTLWSSLTKRGSPLGYAVVSNQSLRVGTNVPHGAYHQEGRGVPQRKFIPDADEIPEQHTDKWEQLIVQHLERGT